MNDAIQQRVNRMRQKSDALNAAAAIFALDPHAQQELAQICTQLAAAKQVGNQAAVEFLLSAIRELFSPPDMDDARDHELVRARLLGEQTDGALRQSALAEAATFHQRYMHYKERCGFRTQQQIAEAAGLSVATVQRIEADPALTPRWETLTQLAAAFNAHLPEAERISANGLRGL